MHPRENLIAIAQHEVKLHTRPLIALASALLNDKRIYNLCRRSPDRIDQQRRQTTTTSTPTPGDRYHARRNLGKNGQWLPRHIQERGPLSHILLIHAYRLSRWRAANRQPPSILSPRREQRRDCLDYSRTLYEVNGSKVNNIVLTSEAMNGVAIDVRNPAVLRDPNSDAPTRARYKAILKSSEKNGLIVLADDDGIGWSPYFDHLILRLKGPFDSQNLASWDGSHFKRWNQAFLRPGPECEGHLALWFSSHCLGPD